MKKFIILFSLSVFCACSYSQNISETKKKPGIYFFKKIHDFGTVYDDLIVNHEFRFINNGNAPLILKNVVPSCGCTTPKWTKQPIMPGDTGTVTAIFRANGFTGQRIQKSLTVMTNVPYNNSNKVIILSFKAFVRKRPLTQKGTQ